MTITEMKQERAGLLDDNRAILKRAENASRDLTSDEEKTVQANLSKAKQLGEDIEIRKEVLIREAENDGPWQPITSFRMGGHSGNRSISKGVEHWRSMSGDNKGKPVPVLANNVKLQRHVDKDDYQGSVEEYLIDRARGFTGGTRAMDTSADSSMVPVGISSQIIDEARALSSVFRAGARVFPMTTKTETIARVTQSAAPSWKAENDSHSASDIVTEPLTFTAKTMIASVKSSVELAEDSSNLAQVVRQNLASQLALELDRVALLGSGSNNEPTGIQSQDDVQTVDLGTNGAELTSYAEFSQAYEKVLSANGTPNATIFSPRTWGVLDRLIDGQNQPLNPPMSFQDLMKLPTSQIPNDLTKGSSEDASIAFVGDFNKLMIGVRTNLVLEVSRAASDSENSAWEDLQIWWRAYLRADIQLMHPDHFCIIDGIIPASES